MERLIVIGIIGFFAQFIDGTLGMGYGAFSASFLIGTGVLPAIASASLFGYENTGEEPRRHSHGRGSAIWTKSRF
jgi:hypothetical protein